MSHKKSFYTIDSLLRILLGTAVTIGVAFLYSPGRFALVPNNGTFLYLLLGFSSALTYAIYKTRGKQIAFGAAFLCGLLLTVPFNSHLIDSLTVMVADPIVLVLFCEALVRWKINRPHVGRFILLAPLYAVVGLVLSPLATLTRPGVYWPILARNGTLQLFGVGIGVGLGLEAAEFAIRLRNRRRAAISHLPDQLTRE